MVPKVTAEGAAVVEIVPNPPKEAVLVLCVGAVCPKVIPAPPEENCSVVPEEEEEPPNTPLLLLDTGAEVVEEGKSEVAEPLPNTEAVEVVEAAVEPPGAASNKGLKVGGGLVSAAVVVEEETLKMGLNPEDSRDALEEAAGVEEGVLEAAEDKGRLKRLGPGAGVEEALGGATVEVEEAGGTEVDRVRLGWT